jgi:hypothetical protein
VAAGQQPQREQPGEPNIDDEMDVRMIEPQRERASDVLLTRFDAAALVPVVQGRQMLLVHVERASDILQALALRDEFKRLRLVLSARPRAGASPTASAPPAFRSLPTRSTICPATFEQLAATQSNVGRMRAAGVQVAIGHINDDETRQIRLMPQYAGNLVALNNVPGATASAGVRPSPRSARRRPR